VATVALNTWSHVAIVRNGNVFALYINGTASGTPITTSAAMPSASAYLYVGQGDNTGGGMIGNIDDVRMTNAARYTTNFTPPAVELPDA
jgi:hypothetical protein